MDCNCGNLLVQNVKRLEKELIQIIYRLLLILIFKILAWKNLIYWKIYTTVNC